MHHNTPKSLLIRTSSQFKHLFVFPVNTVSMQYYYIHWRTFMN